MNLDPILEYLRRVVLPELDAALDLVAAEGRSDLDLARGRRHRADVEAMLSLRHGPQTIAAYLLERADRLEAVPAPLSEAERRYVASHAPWCRGAAEALGRARVHEVRVRAAA
ncbi:MAG: hypothetical protein AAF845_16810 [Bacteroidota bacterium]